MIIQLFICPTLIPCQVYVKGSYYYFDKKWPKVEYDRETIQSHIFNFKTYIDSLAYLLGIHWGDLTKI